MKSLAIKTLEEMDAYEVAFEIVEFASYELKRIDLELDRIKKESDSAGESYLKALIIEKEKFKGEMTAYQSIINKIKEINEL